MKRLLLASIILFIYRDFEAQESYFPTDNGNWETAHISMGCFQGIIVDKWNEHLGGDTMLQNGVNTKLIFQPECTHITPGLNCSESYYYPAGGPYVIGVIHVENGKVFFQKFDVPDNLFSSYEKALENIPAYVDIELYDFNWSLGDTITYPVITGDPWKFKVIKIDVQNGRKRIVLRHENGTGYIIEVFEGMGEKTGLFGMYYSPAASTYLPGDVCFYHDGQLVQNGSCGGCNLVGINELVDLKQAKIYPNPASDEIFIDSDTNDGPFVLRIFNTTGELIYVDKAFPGNINIYTSQLGLSGLLHVVLTNKNGQSRIGNVLVN